MKSETVCIEDRTDHKGNVYSSVSEMCSEYGIEKDTYMKRINRSRWKKCRALETPVKQCKSITTTKIDHLGNAFSTARDMCEYWGISYKTYAERIKKGCSIQEALSGGKTGKLGNIDGSYKPVHRKRLVTVEDRTDHKGKVYDSVKDMCRAYGIKSDTYKLRINRSGWTKEKALETPVKKWERISETKIDHLGNAFSTVKDMCMYWNVSYAVYMYRIKNGYSLEKALTDEMLKHMEPVDHLGQRFNSVTEMRKHWGISKQTFYSRLKRGWSLEKTLTEKAMTDTLPFRGIKCEDHLGNQYSSKKRMMTAYGVSEYQFRKRIKAGMTLEQALTAD